MNTMKNVIAHKQSIEIARIARNVRESLSNKEIDRLSDSEEYVDFIMENCKGDRLICNGDMLLAAVEDGYLFDEFLVAKFV